MHRIIGKIAAIGEGGYLIIRSKLEIDAPTHAL